MWLRTLRTWLGRRPSPIQTRKTNRARSSVKPRLEILEDRVVPTVHFSWDSITKTLTAELPNSGISIGVGAPGGTLQIISFSDSFAFNGGTPSGFTDLLPISGAGFLTTTNT